MRLVYQNMRITHQMEKSHVVDARCISGHPLAEADGTWYLTKFVRRNNRQIQKATIRMGGKRKRNTAPKAVHGFRLFDAVSYHGQVCFVFGRRSSGYFDLRTLDGTKVHASASYKQLNVIQRASTCLIERRRGMQAQDIETYLAELGEELQQQGIAHPIRILLVGGAFMLTQIGVRRTTNDIDVLLKDIEDSTTSSLYRSFKEAAYTVARRSKIPTTWINDVIGDFLRDTGMVPEGTLWRSYAMLEVFIPPEAYILALKLLAGRQKDRDDITSLCERLQIYTRHEAQQVLDQYIPQRVQHINEVNNTLDEFFP